MDRNGSNIQKLVITQVRESWVTTNRTMFEDLDLSGIHEENARELVEMLLNQIDELAADLRQARMMIRKLRDGIKLLKGEQGGVANVRCPYCGSDNFSFY